MKKKLIQHIGFTTGASFGLGLAGLMSLSERYNSRALSFTFIIGSITLAIVTFFNKRKLQK